MENNFNTQQNNLQQPMNQQPMNQQPMYQQPMYQQPMGQPVYLKPRRRTGWIYGLIMGVLMILTFVISFIVYKVADGGDVEGELEGTWSGYGIEITFNESHNEYDRVIYEYIYTDEEGNTRETTCKVRDEQIAFLTEYWDGEEGIYIYDSIIVDIKKITSKKLVLEYDGEEYTLKRND